MKPKTRSDKLKAPNRVGSMRLLGCRHRQSWLIAGGVWEWCYCCGAIRRMKHIRENAVAPDSTWVKPVGERGENPHEAWMKASSLYKERMERRQPNAKLTRGGENTKDNQ